MSFLSKAVHKVEHAAVRAVGGAMLGGAVGSVAAAIQHRGRTAQVTQRVGQAGLVAGAAYLGGTVVRAGLSAYSAYNSYRTRQAVAAAAARAHPVAAHPANVAAEDQMSHPVHTSNYGYTYYGPPQIAYDPYTGRAYYV